MPCLTSNTSMDVATVDDSSGTIYYVTVSPTHAITITFTCSGTIDSISVDPTPPRADGHTLTFTNDHLNGTYTVEIDYTTSSAAVVEGSSPVPVDETPTKRPVFKPVATCP